MKGFVNEGRFRISNDEYIKEWADDPWGEVIAQLHADLKELIPCYDIVQIKEKFGDLRFYYHHPITTSKETAAKAIELVAAAERECFKIEQRRY